MDTCWMETVDRMEKSDFEAGNRRSKRNNSISLQNYVAFIRLIFVCFKSFLCGWFILCDSFSISFSIILLVTVHDANATMTSIGVYTLYGIEPVNQNECKAKLKHSWNRGILFRIRRKRNYIPNFQLHFVSFCLPVVIIIELSEDHCAVVSNGSKNCTFE